MRLMPEMSPRHPETSGKDWFKSDADPSLAQDQKAPPDFTAKYASLLKELRTRVFPWGTVTLTLVTKLTDREHNFPTAVFSKDDPQANTLKGNPFTLDTVDPGTLYA